MTCCRRTILDRKTGYPIEVYSGESEPLRLRLLDDDGVQMPEADVRLLDSLTLTLLDEAGNIINGVNSQSILDTDRGHINTDGTVTVTLRAGDTTTTGVNVVRAEWTWTDGATGEARLEKLEMQYEVIRSCKVRGAASHTPREPYTPLVPS